MRYRLFGVLAACAMLGLGACVGGSFSIAERLASVHNTVSAIGYAQLGPLSEGKLRTGEKARIEFPLTSGRCYLFAALGNESVWNLDLQLLDPQGNVLRRDVGRGPQASVPHCAEASGAHVLEVTMEAGSGRYLVAVWSAGEGAVSGGGGLFGGGGGGGTCDAPGALAVGGTVRGSTAGGADTLTPACLGPGESSSPDAVYQFTLETRASVTLMLTSQYDGVLSLYSECTNSPAAVLDCNDDAQPQDTGHSRIETTLEPGTYYAVVDGYGAAAGGFSLELRAETLRPIAEVCAELAPLTVGEEISGTTAGQGDDFRTTEDCASGARAPDVAYQLVIERPSRVRIRLDSDYDGVLAIRGRCEDAGSLSACNDDFGEGEASRRVSQVVAQLEPGTYTVIVDGYEGEQGTFRLNASVAPQGESTLPNDTCQGAVALAAGTEVEVDTFLGGDDGQGSCAVEPGGSDVVYRIEVGERSLLTARTVRSDFPDVMLYLRRTCAASDSQIACGVGSVSGVVDRGTYYLFVDGARRDSLGSVAVQYELADVERLEAVCSDSPILESGRTLNGTTSGEGRYSASCGEGARNPEAIYQLRIRERSRVRLFVEAQFDSVLHVRRDCVDPASEVGCNDDSSDANHSELDLDLEPGTYYVFVDGYGAENGESGSFTLRAEITSR